MGKTTELILRQDVPNLGHRGDVVRVSSGYSRNFLLPRKLALPLTAGNRKVAEQEKAAAVRREASEQSDAERLAAMISQAVVTIPRKAGETGTLFGSVTSLDVADALHKLGFQIDRRKIVLEEPIKQLGEYPVPVRLHREVTASVNVHVVAEPA